MEVSGLKPWEVAKLVPVSSSKPILFCDTCAVVVASKIGSRRQPVAQVDEIIQTPLGTWRVHEGHSIRRIA